MAESSKAGTVADIMSSPVVTAAPSETIAKVGARMVQNRVGSVVVTDAENRAIGIMTERDLVRFAGSGADASIAKVSEWMTEDPETAERSETVADAFARIAERRYRHIPVVDDGELIGIVSIRDLMRIAVIQPVDKAAIEVPRGLEGVAVAETEIGQVQGLEGFFHYRQYDAVELARTRTLEDVWYLLYEGELPTLDQRRAFTEEVAALRAIPAEVRELLPAIARAGDRFEPLEALRTAFSYTASNYDFRPVLDVSPEELRSNGLRTSAVIPTLLMALYRLSRGEEPVDPDPDLPFAANYLYMLTGERPDEARARALEQYLMLTVDHGFNASTFTARVITSTGADMGAAIVGAIGALSGPLHGAAPTRALDMLDEIEAPDRAEEWLRRTVEGGGRLMGFGHRVYKTDDPRSLMLREVASSLGGPRVELAKVVEEQAITTLDELKPGRRLYTNVEFYAAVTLEAIGLPRTMFTPTFTSSRSIGWTAHIIEQASDNRLIRPTAHYVGPPPPQPVPEPA